MKTKPPFFIAILLLISITVISQTKIIAHKSHSGKMSTFSIKSEGNFGLPAHVIDSIRKISENVIVEYSRYNFAGSPIDTVVNHPLCSNPKISLDSLKKLYPARVKFIGFESANADDTQKNELQIVGPGNSGDQNNQKGIPIQLLILTTLFGITIFCFLKLNRLKSSLSGIS